MEARRTTGITNIFFLKGVLIFAICLVILMGIQTAAIVYLPTLVRDFVISVTGVSPKFYFIIKIVIYLGVIQLSLSILSGLTNITASYLSSQSQYKLRLMFFKKLSRLPINYFRMEEIGEIQSHFSHDLEVLNKFISDDLPKITIAFLGSVSILIVFMLYNIELALILLVLIIFISFFLIILHRYQYYFSEKMRNQFGKLTQIFLETVRGIDVLKAFTSEKRQIEKFSSQAFDYRRITRKSSIIQALFSAPISFSLNSFSLTVMGVGSYILVKGRISSELLILCLFYADYLQNFTSQLLSSLYTFHTTRVAAKRFMNFFDKQSEKTEINENPGALTRSLGSPGEMDIKLEKVTFNYPDREVILKNISFEVSPGQSIALLGKSGSGKTTLANLLLGFYQPVSGNIIINGIDTKNIQTEELRESIAYFDQQAFLFQTTIRENIIISNPEADEEKIMLAIKKAGASDIIEGMPDGIDTIVGSQGLTLSAGQRQRICLARTLLKDSPIMIFDEPTVSLDPKNVQLIFETIRNLIDLKTVIIITHEREVAALARKTLSLD